MKSIGMHPPEVHARAVALSETIGGGLTAAGFLSPLGPAMIMGTMAVAIKKVHLKNGLWVSKRGYEYNLLLIASAFALAADGPGLLSVDWLLGKQRKGLKWALAAAALGAGAAAGALRLGDQFAPAPATNDPGDVPAGGSGLPGGDAPAGSEPTVVVSVHDAEWPAPDLSEAHLSDEHGPGGNGAGKDRSAQTDRSEAHE
jgi:putative oxidoreductase